MCKDRNGCECVNMCLCVCECSCVHSECGLYVCVGGVNKSRNCVSVNVQAFQCVCVTVCV